MDDSFVNLVEYKAGCAQRLFIKKKKGVNSDFAMTIWRFWISYCKYVLLSVQVFAIDCSNAEFCASCVWVCVCVSVWGEQGHITAEYTAR